MVNFLPLPPLFVVAVVPMVRLCPSDVIFGPPIFPSSGFCDAFTRTSGGLLKFGFCCCWWWCMMLANAVEDMLPVGGETLSKKEKGSFLNGVMITKDFVTQPHMSHLCSPRLRTVVMKSFTLFWNLCKLYFVWLI